MNERINRFRTLMLEVFNSREVDEMIDDMMEYDFFNAPASVSHHGNQTGGLFEHSYLVTKCLLELTEKLNLKWELQRSPYVVGMFHDLCKCDNYRRCPEGTDPEHWEYNNAALLTGHGEKSVIMLQQLMKLTTEEMLCIRWHMGAFDDKENWNNYGRSVTQFPNVLFTHTADMMAARIHGI